MSHFTLTYLHIVLAAVVTLGVDGIRSNNMLRGGTPAKAAFPGGRMCSAASMRMLLIQMAAYDAIEAIPSTRAAAGILSIVYKNIVCNLTHLFWTDFYYLLFHLEGLKVRRKLRKCWLSWCGRYTDNQWITRSLITVSKDSDMLRLLVLRIGGGLPVKYRDYYLLHQQPMTKPECYRRPPPDGL